MTRLTLHAPPGSWVAVIAAYAVPCAVLLPVWFASSGPPPVKSVPGAPDGYGMPGPTHPPNSGRVDHVAPESELCTVV